MKDVDPNSVYGETGEGWLIELVWMRRQTFQGSGEPDTGTGVPVKVIRWQRLPLPLPLPSPSSSRQSMLSLLSLLYLLPLQTASVNFVISVFSGPPSLKLLRWAVDRTRQDCYVCEGSTAPRRVVQSPRGRLLRSLLHSRSPHFASPLFFMSSL